MKKLRITIDNKSYEVTVEDLTEAEPLDAHLAPAPAAPANAPAQPARAAAPPRPPATLEQGAVASPMAGSIKSVLVKAGDSVTQGQPLIVLEAMKMENQITAPIAGTVKSVSVTAGESVQEGHVLAVLE